MKNLTQETIAHTIRTAPETSTAQTIRDSILGDSSMPSDCNAIIELKLGHYHESMARRTASASAGIVCNAAPRALMISGSFKP
jgi:hypothetical protein